MFFLCRVPKIVGFFIVSYERKVGRESPHPQTESIKNLSTRVIPSAENEGFTRLIPFN